MIDDHGNFIATADEPSEPLRAQRVTLDQAREDVAKRTAMASDMQPEKRELRIADLPESWLVWSRRMPPNSAEKAAFESCSDELRRVLSREPHITLSADAVQTLAGSRDLQRKCARLEREVDAYRRALSLVISVRMMEEP